MFDQRIGNGWVILIVDDHPDNIAIAKTALEFYGAEVHIAMNGAEGLAFLDSIRPTAILLDLSMPVMSGWEMFEKLRDYQDISGVPIIAVTAHAMDNDRKRVLQAGFDCYISKPYDIHALITHIQTTLVVHPINKGKIGAKREMTHAPPTTGARNE